MPRPRAVVSAILLLALLLAARAAHGDTAAAVVEAQELARSGDATAAREAWLAVARRAEAEGDVERTMQAREALADIDFQQGRYDTYRAFHESLRETAEQRGDERVRARALLGLGILERRLGHLESARPLFEQALALWQRLGDRDGEAQTLTHLGLVLLNQGEYSDSLRVLSRSLELQESGAHAELDRTYHYLGLLYRSLNEFDDAREFLRQGLEMAALEPDPMRQPPLLGSLARVANDSGHHTEALHYSQRAADISRRFDSMPGLAYAALERGRALLGLERLEEARATLEACMDLADSIDQQRTRADAAFSLARLAVREQRIDDALALVEDALPSYEDAADGPQTLEAYRLLIPLLRQRGELARALQLSEASLTLQDRISSLQANRRLALAENAQRNAEAQRRIELLTRDNEIQALRLRQEVLTRQLGLVALAGLGLVLVALLYRYRRSRRLAEGLEQSRAQLAEAHQTLAVRAAELLHAARTDELTGVANRGHVLDRLRHLLQTRGKRPLSLLLIDVDHFKLINDEHGHLAGDDALVRTARRIEAQCPDQGLLGRFGGEEFLLVLPDHDAVAAAALAERIRGAVATIGNPPVTVSIGVACRCADGADGDDVDALFDAADRALYRAKAEGRNRVVVAEPDGDAMGDRHV